MLDQYLKFIYVWNNFIDGVELLPGLLITATANESFYSCSITFGRKGISTTVVSVSRNPLPNERYVLGAARSGEPMTDTEANALMPSWGGRLKRSGS